MLAGERGKEVLAGSRLKPEIRSRRSRLASELVKAQAGPRVSTTRKAGFQQNRRDESRLERARLGLDDDQRADEQREDADGGGHVMGCGCARLWIRNVRENSAACQDMPARVMPRSSASLARDGDASRRLGSIDHAIAKARRPMMASSRAVGWRWPRTSQPSKAWTALAACSRASSLSAMAPTSPRASSTSCQGNSTRDSLSASVPPKFSRYIRSNGARDRKPPSARRGPHSGDQYPAGRAPQNQSVPVRNP